MATLTRTTKKLYDRPVQRSRTYTWLKRLLRKPTAIVGLLIVLAFLVIALTAPWISPHNYDLADFTNARRGPSAVYPLGNDELGRDMLSRLFHGARISLTLGLTSVAIGLLIGVPLGILSGYFGGTLNLLIMSAVDIMLAFPSILLAIMLVAFLGPSLQNAMLAIGILSIPVYTRLVRSSTLTTKEELFIEAARALGASHLTILWRHILPNVLAPVIVQSTLQMAVAIQAAAALGFLGLGAPPDVPEWGNMLQKGRTYIFSAPHIVLYPGLATMLVVFGFSLLGDGLRDVLDPRLNRD
ncbi:MAG: ABC transporter permease [Chloroflexota bacterium]|nr:MAG: glutathione ABC transporter permease GsiD [Chloroflexota bacterium]